MEQPPRLERQLLLPKINRGLDSLPKNGGIFEMFVLSGSIAPIPDASSGLPQYRTTTQADLDARGAPSMGAWREKAGLLIAKNFPGVPVTVLTWSAFSDGTKQPYPVSDAQVMRDELIRDGVNPSQIRMNVNPVDTCTEMLEIVSAAIASDGGHKAIITTSFQIDRAETMLVSILRMNNHDYKQLKRVIKSYDKRFFSHFASDTLRPRNTDHFLHVLAELKDLHKPENLQRLQCVYRTLQVTLIPAEEAIMKLGSSEDVADVAFMRSQAIQDEIARTQKGITEWENGIYGASKMRRRMYNLTHPRRKIVSDIYSLGKRGV